LNKSVIFCGLSVFSVGFHVLSEFLYWLVLCVCVCERARVLRVFIIHSLYYFTVTLFCTPVLTRASENGSMLAGLSTSCRLHRKNLV